MAIRKVLYQHEPFELVEENRRDPRTRGKGPRVYTISCNKWWLHGDETTAIRNTIDPLHNISSKTAMRWRFKDLNEAKKRYSMLLLKFSEMIEYARDYDLE